MTLLFRRSEPVAETGFKQEHEFQKREAEAKRILASYPDRIPIIVERSQSARNTLPEMDKKKFLCPGEITVGQFQYVIRKRLKLAPEHALFLNIKGQMPPSSALLSSVYQEHKEDDGFL
ncbi:hypothetical protein HK104_006308 [Borealophlyctis nickersoniae]|nr:hypothetical protein HK104_006308 [Borealophlyctis nickersoniae]